MSRTTLALPLLLVVLAALGCSSRAEYQHAQYPRPLTEAGRMQLARDQYECEKEHRFNDRLIRLCMESRGWYLVREKK
jgi:hypothetical protein